MLVDVVVGDRRGRRNYSSAMFHGAGAALLVATVGTVAAAGGAPSDASIRALRVRAPSVAAPGVPIRVTVVGGPPSSAVSVESRARGGWSAVGDGVTNGEGGVDVRVMTPLRRERWRLRVRLADGGVTPVRTVRVRAVMLDAVGDVNLGDGPGAAIGARGARWLWAKAGPTLRRADVAFGNLECAVSTRGAPVPKAFHFRSPPGRLGPLRRLGGFDVVNLANNHVGDFGRQATADTVRNVRRAGLVAVGAGLDRRDAARPRIVRRLGLRIAFVGFSDIEPFSFVAGSATPGTRRATIGNVRHDVRAAARRADVVVASMHWGVEYDPAPPTTRQRALARAALAAGASVVIGAHPHVLEPIVRPGRRRLVAYSLGNFVFSPRTAWAARTGILELGLSARGVEHAHLRRARIVGTRPVPAE